MPPVPAVDPQLAQAQALIGAGRIPEAMMLLTRLAAQNQAGALRRLAELRWTGAGVPANQAEARELFRRAGAAGDHDAGHWFTNLLASGIGGPRDWTTALSRLATEAKNDPARAAALAMLAQMDLAPDGEPAAVPKGEIRSTAPKVTFFPGLFSAAECDYLRRFAEPHYAPSFVNSGNGRLVRDTMRTSDGATLAWLIEDPAVHALNRRLAAASGTDAGQGEALQILRYRPGQQYRPHLDFVRASANNRVLTALVWLNADFQGGETQFVKTGLTLKGRKGDAMVFRNAGPDSQPDPLSEHAGLAVTKGTKYLASRWIREHRWVP